MCVHIIMIQKNIFIFVHIWISLRHLSKLRYPHDFLAQLLITVIKAPTGVGPACEYTYESE